MSSPARSLEPVRYLPIDGLIASLEDALAEIAEIESRRGGVGVEPDTWKPRPPAAGTIEQHERMHNCRAVVQAALSFARAYAKGPTA